MSLRAIADKIERGQRLEREDGLALFASNDLLTIGRLANLANVRKNGERVYFAANQAICLVPELGLYRSDYKIVITDGDFKTKFELPFAGIPSRARISPDGRYGAATSFLAGHSYAADSFSTRTVIIDMARGVVIADLEKDFTITRAGKRIDDRDFNFWGVTFARRSGRFYATLRTGDKTYLLEGDVASRRARVLHENVECPSISPDGTRIAYKKSISGAWELYVLELKTMKETPVPGTRGIDDQVEWLDDGRILYGRDADLWSVRSDGSARPREYLSRALSPAVVRAPVQ
jgi:Tol biopolymer transport system component